MGYQPGQGLLANPSDPARQLQFAAGLAAVPGKAGMGLDLLNAAFGRAQQADQFKAGQAQQQSQFDTSQNRQAEQFGKSFGLQQDQFANQKSEQQAQAERWAQNFAAQQEEARQRLANDNARLGLERERVGIARAGAETKQTAAELPKLSPGMMWAPSASGLVAAPIPGTKDYADAVGQHETLSGAEKRIARLVDLVAGEEQTVNGQKVRVGGAGSEAWGEKSATYSTLRAGIISDVAKLRDMGVLQAGEMANLEDQLPDPGSWQSTFRRNSSMVKAYQELGDQFKAKRSAHLKANPWMVPPPPAGYRPQ